MEDYIYGAGLFDGEGTVTMLHRHKSAKYRSPVLSMTSTTHELVLFMKNLFEGHICNHTKKNVNHSQAWSWRIWNDKALSALSRISPFLKEPEKRRRSDLLLSLYKKLTIRNGKYSESQHITKLEFESQFFHPSTPYLNTVGAYKSLDGLLVTDSPYGVGILFRG